MKSMLDAYFRARTWYEKAQTTDAGTDSMYNQGRQVVKAFLDAFEATYFSAVPYPGNTTLPFVPSWPSPYPCIPTGSGAPLPPYGTEITCGPRVP